MTKSLTIQYTDGTSESWNVPDNTAGEAVAALSRQEAAHPLVIGEATVYLNMRQVCSLAVGAAEEGEPEVPEQPAEDTRTVAELKEALDKANVEYDSTAKKADLQELAKANGL